MLMWACGGSDGKKVQPKTFQEVEEEFASTLTASDTTQVFQIATQVMDSLKSGNVEWAVGNFFECLTRAFRHPLVMRLARGCSTVSRNSL